MSDVTETRHGPGGAPAARKVMGAVLVFSENPSEQVPRGFELAAACRIGRDTTAEIPINDTQASRLHASLTPSPGGVHVADLGSRNGTWVNGARLSSHGAFAPVGAMVRCGRSLLRIVDDVAPFEVRAPSGFESLVGGPAMGAVRELIRTIAPLPHSVLLLGETGTGKEVVAGALHAASGRRGELVSVNCGAMPAELVESELFGHARGAFSGSDRQRTGLFRAADRGTLLLDELGELPLAAQAKLLRAMEQHEVRPVGEDRPIPVDVRVIGATNVNLEQAVAKGAFRADLFHRIAVWQIPLPALRERIEDVPLLAKHFLADEPVTFSVEAMEKLMLCSWPGNVRELRNAVTTAAARARAARRSAIGVEQLPAIRPAAPAPRTTATDVETAALRARIETALALRDGNVSHVAKDLGCTRPWLYLTLKRLHIDAAAFRKGK
ncbi:MAG: sigma 54-interacting transcriptional regulator [Deltaproteobacteria bacterium]|nr:sigma 54-interacting transcriptional regulator [Deltaproteobacteria bacterium]